MLLTRKKYDEFTSSAKDCYWTGIFMADDFNLFISFFHFHMNGMQDGTEKLKHGSNFIFKPFHYRLTNVLSKYARGENEKQHLIINIFPRVGKCLDLDSKILTPYRGRVKLRYIHTGDFLYSYKDRRLVISRVLGEEDAYKDSYKVTTRSGREIIGSYDHPMLTFHGWKRFDELQLGIDYISCLNSEVESLIEIDDNELKFITYMLFEGNCNNRATKFTTADKKILKDFTNCCKCLDFNIKKISKYDYNVSANYTTKVIDLIKEYGIDCLAKHKKLPFIFFNLSMRQKLIFLGLMIQTDGYINKNGGFGITLASKDLIDDLQCFLSMCGLVSCKRYKRAKIKNKIFDSWRLELGMSQLEKVIGKVDFGSKLKNISKIRYKSKKANTDIYPAELQKLIPKNRDKSVLQNLNDEVIAEYTSLRKAEIATGINISNISYSCKHSYHKAGGFKWKYKNNNTKKGKTDFGIDYSKNVTPEKFDKMCNFYPPLEEHRNIDFYWDRVEKIEYIGKRKLKHIEVEGTHNFLANDLVSHNTILMTYFIAWCLTRNVRSNFIYTSYADSLAYTVSDAIRAVLESELYTKCYKFRLDPRKNSKEHWRLAGYGGGLYAAPMGGRITGFGAGILGGAGFCGCLCFPYDEFIWTDRGLLKIGELVENSIECKVWSYNIASSVVELKDVLVCFTNPGSKIIEVVYSNGTVIRCTPDHKALTRNRGYISACDLLKSDTVFSLVVGNCSPRYSVFFSNFRKCSNFICNLFLKFYTKFSFFRCALSCSRQISNFKIFSNFFIRKSKLNSSGRCMINLIDFSKFIVIFFRFKYFNHLLFGKFRAWMLGPHGECSMFFSVNNVFYPSPPFKILKSIISFVPIKMSAFMFWCRSFKSKGKQYSLMNLNKLNLTVFAGSKLKVAMSIFLKFNNFFRNFIKKSFFSGNNSFFASNSADVRNAVKPFKTYYASPLVVRDHSFSPVTYCISVKDNNNMLMGKSQGVVYSNCVDDPIKTADCASTLERQKKIDFYAETLKNRLNSPMTTPIIIIMQRLHNLDLCGYIESNPDEFKDYEVVKFPACNEELTETIWPERFSIDYFKKLKNTNPFYFYSQYMQNPIIRGGNIIKGVWFRYYSSFENVNVRRVFITADTAMKVKEHNDFTVFCVWAIDLYNNLHLVDMVRGKWESPELVREALMIWQRFYAGINGVMCGGCYVEDKSSGVGLIQILQNKTGIPVIPVACHKDKLTRVEMCLEFIESGKVFLPEDRPILLNDFLFECESFTRNNSHSHDDIVDCLTMAVALCAGNVGILAGAIL